MCRHVETNRRRPGSQGANVQTRTTIARPPKPRATAQRNPTVALATAAELPRVPLAEALAICLLLLDRQPHRYEAAAVRWHSRFCRQARPSLVDAHLLLAALHSLGGPGTEAAADCLSGLCEAADERECAA